MKILRVLFEKLPLFSNGKMEINLIATDRVTDQTQVFYLNNSIYTQKLIAFVGINASGKTSSLKLLHFAMDIVINNNSLNNPNIKGRELVQDGTIMTVDFFHQNQYYELVSTIREKVVATDNPQKPKLYFAEEYLKVKNKSTVTTRKEIFDFSEKNVSITKRTSISPEVLAVLKDDTSIVIRATKDNTISLVERINQTNINVLHTIGTTPPVVLNVFDSNIEELTGRNNIDDTSYRVKFKKSDKAIVVNNVTELGNFVSSGTIKGQNIMADILNVLKSGGYLIIDELENHLNKEIIRMITDIFKDKDINRQGACLIFSTHYAEILDFMDRKDNIYVFRRQENKNIELLNYATQVQRNDVKKSEVILSNFIKGTAPLYENIRVLKDILCKM